MIADPLTIPPSRVIGPNAAGVAVVVCADMVQLRLLTDPQLLTQLFATVRTEHPTLRSLLPVFGGVYEHLLLGNLTLR